MENRRNYYRVLHVQPDAPAEIIKTSYRTMMQRMKMHPDLGGDHFTATMINEAYATLMDADKRAAYDQTLSAPADEFSAEAERAEAEAAAEPRHSAGTSDQSEANRCAFCATAYPAQNIDRLSNCGKCGSPLLLAETQRHDDGARRAVARMPKSFGISFVTEWPS
ncbi:MAG: J domain-containing protein, partial [Gammaproteobacteria bacterium]|nr:J domain-containing protein [Gammaproteobacteria bacterium]